jgi:mannosyltransferase
MSVSPHAAAVDAPPSPPAPWWARLYRSPLPEGLVVLVATLVRLWRLEYHSIWFDEAVSLAWAGSDPGYTWRVTFQLVEEKHPPVYYLLLHYWQAAGEVLGLGQSDGYLRALGSLLGVLTVLGIMLLARRVSGRTTGLLAGLLVALSPVLVWYSQELRMFQPTTTFIVWGAYAMARAIDEARTGRRLAWWAIMVAGFTAALYSYLFSAFVLPAAGFTVLALALTGRDKEARLRRFVEGAVALAMTGALFLPLALNAWGVNADESTPGRAFADFLPNLRGVLKVFTIWRMPWPDLWLWLLALLVLVGLTLPFTRRRVRAPLDDRLWLALWIGTPLLIANLLLSRSDSIFGEDRYLLFLAPFVLWALARGIVALGDRWQPAGWLAGALVVGLLALALPRLWTPDAYRENWRSAADYIVNDRARSPGIPAAAVAHVDYTRRPLEWYVRQALTFDELPIFFPFGGTLSPDQVDDVVAPPLAGLVDFGAETLWLTQSHLDGVDDQRVVEGWLNANFPLVTEQYPAGVKLTGYALRSEYGALPELAAGAVYPDAELAPGLTLAACEITTPTLAATDDAMHPPSGWVHVRLWWQSTAPLADDYIAMVQMVGPEGVWGDRLYRENEALRRRPTSTWTPGTLMRDEVDVNLNPVTPPGRYPIAVGLMDGTGAPVNSWVECGQVEIVAR